MTLVLMGQTRLPLRVLSSGRGGLRGILSHGGPMASKRYLLSMAYGKEKSKLAHNFKAHARHASHVSASVLSSRPESELGKPSGLTSESVAQHPITLLQQSSNFQLNNEEWTVRVRDRVMVARRFSSSTQRSSSAAHESGGTLLIDATFSGPKLEPGPNFLLDIGFALTTLGGSAGKIRYKDLGVTSLEAIAVSLQKEISDGVQNCNAIKPLIQGLHLALEDPMQGIFVKFGGDFEWGASSLEVGAGLAHGGFFPLNFPMENGRVSLEMKVTPEAIGHGSVFIDAVRLQSVFEEEARHLAESMSSDPAMRDVVGLSPIRSFTFQLHMANRLWHRLRYRLISSQDAESHVEHANGGSVSKAAEAGSNALGTGGSRLSLRIGNWFLEGSLLGFGTISDHLGSSAAVGPIKGVSDPSITFITGRPIRVTHSFQGDCFGPAQGTHGTSFGVEVGFRLQDARSFGMDFGVPLADSVAMENELQILDAHVRSVLNRYDRRNLDELDCFRGENTTCEFMAKRFGQEILATSSADLSVEKLTINVVESDVASVSYSAMVEPRSAAVKRRSATAKQSIKEVAVEQAHVMTIARQASAPSYPTLLFDLDGVLFNDSIVHSRLVAAIHNYCENSYGLSREESDRLHRQYGATVEGLIKEKIIQNQDEIRKFYTEVYGVVDERGIAWRTADRNGMSWSRLLSSSDSRSSFSTNEEQSQEKKSKTGWDSTTDFRDLLLSLPHRKFIASNSHSAYVRQVLKNLGLEDAFANQVWTPDTIAGGSGWFAKTNPLFWESLCTGLGANSNVERSKGLIFFDDCEKNVSAARKAGLESSFLVDNNTQASSLTQILLKSLLGPDLANPMQPAAYCEALRRLNVASVNKGVQQELEHELKKLLEVRRKNGSDQMDSSVPMNHIGSSDVNMTLRFLDMGAGLVPHFESLVAIAKNAGFNKVVYTAVERDDAVRAAAAERVASVLEQKRSDVDVQYISQGGDFLTISQSELPGATDVVVCSSFVDLVTPRVLITQLQRLAPGALVYAPLSFSGEMSFSFTGSAMSHDRTRNNCISSQLVHNDTPLSDKNLLKVTEAYLAHLAEDNGAHLCLSTFQKEGEGLGSVFIVGVENDKFEKDNFNSESDKSNSSDWILSLGETPEMYRNIMHLISVGSLRKLYSNPAAHSEHDHERIRRLDDPVKILQEMSTSRELQMNIRNRDLLFRLPAASMVAFSESDHRLTKKNIEAMFFVAPGKVDVRPLVEQDMDFKKPLPAYGMQLETICSLISPGTEMRLFTGNFGENEPVDATLKLGDGDVFRFPMRYGYQLIGRVRAIGSEVPLRLLGTTVFAFQPHGRIAFVHDYRSGVVELPSVTQSPLGLEDYAYLANAAPVLEDYAFLAAIETAVSLVHDSEVKCGDSVAVFGQGLIGQLTAAVLNLNKTISIHIIDPDRLRLTAGNRYLQRVALGATLGSSVGGAATDAQNHCATHATTGAQIHDVNGTLLHTHLRSPFVSATASDNDISGASICGNGDSNKCIAKFDVCIEVSGSPNALNDCIASTRPSGKIVVGSWYGHGQKTHLDLDTDFHRSKIQIVSSQVSTVPGKLSDAWNKERRMRLCVDLIKQLKPYQWMRGSDSLQVLPLEECQTGMETIRARQAVAVLLKYGSEGKKSSTTILQASSKVETREESTQNGIHKENLPDHPLSIKPCSPKHRVSFISQTELPTEFGMFRVATWKLLDPLPRGHDRDYVLTLSTGEIGLETDELLMRIHDACFTSEILGSCKCDCKQQLQLAQKMIAEHSRNFDLSETTARTPASLTPKGTPKKGGLIVYCFQEGRGIGLSSKLSAYHLQMTQGLDTVDANLALSLPDENRSYDFLPSLLEEMGIVIGGSIRVPSRKTGPCQITVLTNNPFKLDMLHKLGVPAKRKPILVKTCKQNDAPLREYLDAKEKKMGHMLSPCDTGVCGTGMKCERHESERDRGSNPDHRAQRDHGFIREHDSAISGLTSTNRNQENTAPSTSEVSEVLSLVKQNRSSHGMKSSLTIPFVTLTYAQAFDGSIGARRGHDPQDRLLLSGPEAYRMTHQLRALHQAILVGIGTVLADDPRLTIRLDGGEGNQNTVEHPIPVVIDPFLRIPLSSNLVAQARKGRKLILICNSYDGRVKEPTFETNGSAEIQSAPRDHVKENFDVLCEIPNISIIPALVGVSSPMNSNASMNSKEAGPANSSLLPAFQQLRSEFGVRSLMIEGGSKVIAHLLFGEPQLVAQTVITMSPSFHATGNVIEAPRRVGANRSTILENLVSFKAGRDIVIVGSLK